MNEPPFCGDWSQILTVSSSDVTVTEGGMAAVTVTAAGSGSGTVQYRTVDGTATAPRDFLDPGASTLTFAGPGTRTVIVPTIDDTEVEGTETFTVRLSNASGVDIGTALATVTIIDNDGDNDDAPCPAGQTGTPPNCVPIVVSTGCGVPAARLSALTVTAGGSSVLSGFSSTTYSYAVTVDGASAGFTATAADAAAVVRIGSGSASTGSASSTQYVAEGGSVDVEVVVTSGGDSCTYAVTVNRPSAGLTDCPAFSGQELVDGVCVDACGSGLIVQFDSDGQVAGCIAVGDCPFEMYGTTAAEVQRLGSFTSGPLWLDGPKAHAAMAAGETATLSRRAVKCDEIWPRDPWSISVGVPHTCIWNERNVGGSDGDCLKFSLSVEAVVPEVEDTANRWSPA